MFIEQDPQDTSLKTPPDQNSILKHGYQYSVPPRKKKHNRKTHLLHILIPRHKVSGLNFFEFHDENWEIIANLPC